MKRILCILLVLLLVLTACGKDDKPAKDKPEKDQPSAAQETPARQETPAEPEAPAKTETPAEPEPEAQKTLDECEARLIDYYVLDGRAYFCCAVETPPGRRLTCSPKVGGETSGTWILMGAVPGWTIFYADGGFPHAPALSDIQLLVVDCDDDSERLFGDWEPASPETYPEYSIFPVGDCYTLLAGGSLTKWKNEDYVDLSIQAPNLYLQDLDEIKQEDFTTEMFSLYAADGTPLEEAMGLPVAYSIRETPHGLEYEARFGEAGCTPAKKELAEALAETAGYYVFHCADGNDYTIPFKLSV